MAIVSKPLVQALFVTFKKNFQDGIKTAEPDYLRIATVVPSNTAQNIYAWLGLFPKMREWVGKRVIKSMKEEGYAITNKLYEATVGVPRTAIEDDTVSQYSTIMKQAGKSAARYPGELIWKLIKNGESQTCYDGQNFFDDSHPVAENEDGTGEVATVSNILKPKEGETASPKPWYVMVTNEPLKPFLWQERLKPALESKENDINSDHVFMNDEFLYGVRARGAAGVGYWQMCIKCTAPLTAANFEKACLMIEEFTADGNVPLDFKADLLVVPTSLKSAAKKIVSSKTINNGDDNPNYQATDLLVTPWLN